MGASPVEVAAIREAVARDIMASANRGNVGASWRTWAEQTLAPAEVRWQETLRRLVEASVRRAGVGRHTWNRVSRRQAGVGFGGGRPIVPGRVRVTPETWMALDTSGSMGDAEIQGALNEVAGIIKAVAGPVTFVACDARVHGQGRVRTWREAQALVGGGGGTDFCPVFEAMEKARRHPDVLIVLTDGIGPAPETPPKGTEVVWVLLGPYARQPVAWGTSLRIEP